MSLTTAQPAPKRIKAVDLARAAALVAMAIYHFAWDLEFFGYSTPGTTGQGGWKLFARGIATSFLFLVGVSLVLSARGPMNWRAWGIRLAQIAGAAALITLVTYFAVPDAFIFFGILHAIALFTLLATPLVWAPWWIAALLAGTVFWIAQNFTAPLFDHPALLWAGLSPTLPLSNDYVPLFPWFAATCAGVASCKLALKTNLPNAVAQVSLWPIIKRPALFLARHSLAVYLAHQPILITLIWCFATLTGGPDRTAAFDRECRAACTATQGEAFCTTYCGCMREGLVANGTIATILDGKQTAAQNEGLLVLRDQCSAGGAEAY